MWSLHTGIFSVNCGEIEMRLGVKSVLGDFL